MLRLVPTNRRQHEFLLLIPSPHQEIVAFWVGAPCRMSHVSIHVVDCVLLLCLGRCHPCASSARFVIQRGLFTMHKYNSIHPIHNNNAVVKPISYSSCALFVYLLFFCVACG